MRCRDGDRCGGDEPAESVIDLRLNGRPVGKLHGPRERLRAFERDLEAVARSVVKK